MNLAPSLVDNLCQRTQDASILLTPGAQALVRDRDGVSTLSTQRLSVDDVLETLTALLGRLPSSQMVLQQEGHFAFGVPQHGRFQVSYITQRGSYAVQIARIPQGIPPLADLLEPGQAEEVAAHFLALPRGVLLLAGSDPRLANRLGYGLVGHLNQHEARVVYTLETCLSHMLRHDRSVVLQAEVGQDVPSFERGVEGALRVGATVVYLSGLRSVDELRVALRAATAGALVVISLARLDLPLALAGAAPLALSPLQLGVWHVEEGSTSGLLSVNLRPETP